ncbi:MAG: transposase, partial [Solirubrobacteraceae bacterium]
SEQTEAPSPDPLNGLEGIEPVAEISTPSGRLGRLQAALAEIEAQEQQARKQAKAKAKAAFQEAGQGRKLPGRKPKDPAAALERAKADLAAALKKSQAKQAERTAKTAAGAPPRGPAPGPDRGLEHARQALAAAQALADATPAEPPRANITDADSRIMKTRKGWVQGYNAQAIVNERQIVLAIKVSQDGNDQELYKPMIEELQRTLKRAGIPPEQAGLMLADAGYCSEANLTADGPERLIATQKDHKQRQAARQLGTTTGQPPEDASPVEAMEHRLRTPEGAAAYAKRGHLIEPIFGDRKHNHGYRNFRRRGLPAVQSEWAFMHLAGNLKKLYDHQHAATATAPA